MWFASSIPKTVHTGRIARHVLPKYYYIGCYLVPFFYEDELGKYQVGQAEQLRIVPPGNIIHHGALEDDLPFSDAYIYVAGEDVPRMLEQFPLPLNRAFSVKNPHLLQEHIRRLLNERQQRLPGYEQKVHHMLCEMIIDLHRSYIQIDSKNMRFEKVEAVHVMMEKNPAKNWTLPEMCSLSGYSSSRFSALYTERYGVSPVEDLIRLRIQNAKDLLKFSGKSITTIAEETGFSNIHYFSRRFKDSTGMSPTEYIKRYKPKSE